MDSLDYLSVKVQFFGSLVSSLIHMSVSIVFNWSSEKGFHPGPFVSWDVRGTRIQSHLVVVFRTLAHQYRILLRTSHRKKGPSLSS